MSVLKIKKKMLIFLILKILKKGWVTFQCKKIEKKVSLNQWSYKQTLATKVWCSGRKEWRLAERSEAGENERRVAERSKAEGK